MSDSPTGKPNESSKDSVNETEDGSVAPAQNSSSADNTSPQTMGDMVIPDLSPLTVGENDAVKAMTAVTKEASQALEKIVTAQRAAMENALKNLQTAVQESSGGAAMSNSKIPTLDVQIQNLELSIDNFCANAETLTNSMTGTYTILETSIKQSLAKIQETATKFSGG